MQVGVVITTHLGVGEMLRRCVDSVTQAGGADMVVVVDNSGVTPSIGAHGGDIDDVVLVQNHGFGAAANAGFRRVVDRLGPDCGLALLNDDVTVTPRWLEPLVAVLDADGGVGAVQPKLLVAGSRPPVVNSVGVRLDRFGAGIDIGYNAPDGPAWSVAGPIEIFTGGAVLLRASFIEDLDGFDERFFLYYEDVDLSLRGRERGWAFRCAPLSVVAHAGGASAESLGDDVRRLQDRNRLWTAFRFGSARGIVSALWLSIRRLRHHPRRMHRQALLAGMQGAPRRLFERLRSNARSQP